MKCIYCGNDSKYRERADGRCAHCRKHFAFEPKSGDQFTDMAFKAAIDAVSANGQVRWGVEHLYYELCRRLRRWEFGWGKLASIGWGKLARIGFVLVIVVSILAKAFVAIFFLLPIALGIWLLLRRYGRSTTAQLDQAKFDDIWRRWVNAHGQPPGVILRKSQPKSRKTKEPDIGDYSFDRAVICDRARTVDLLLANNFHFENNCAILSEGGYPEGPFETVRAMLKRNPKLHVFALHDATVAGCKLAHRLANEPAWFRGHVPVTDVGLRPGHAKPFEGLFLPPPAMASLMPGEGIGSEEIPWLRQYALELAAIRPEQILKRLFRAINRQTDQVVDRTPVQESYVSYDDASFSSDAGDSDGGADSFG